MTHLLFLRVRVGEGEGQGTWPQPEQLRAVVDNSYHLSLSRVLASAHWSLLFLTSSLIEWLDLDGCGWPGHSLSYGTWHGEGLGPGSWVCSRVALDLETCLTSKNIAASCSEPRRVIQGQLKTVKAEWLVEKALNQKTSSSYAFPTTSVAWNKSF